MIDTTGMGFDEAFTTEEGSKANPGEAQIVSSSYFIYDFSYDM